MITRKISTLVLIFLLLCFSDTIAAVYSVDPANGGLDGNVGSIGAPWGTIQHAASSAVAGDTVYVQAGNYSEKVTFPNSGTAGSLISFIGVGNVVVQGTASVALWNGIFNINTKGYILIKNFSLKNSYWFGIYIESSNNIYIENDSTYTTGASGITAWHSDNIYASNNVVQKACYQSLSTGSQECITFSGVTNFEIHHNEVFESGGSNNGGEGIDTKENCSNGKVYNNVLHDLSRLGIYADCWDKTLQNVEIYNNKIYNCSEGIVLSSENGGTLTNVKVYNNITYNNNNFGITVSDYGTNGLRQNISIMNNTVYKNGYGDSNTGWGGGIIILTTNVSKINIFNNIVSNNDAMQISDKSGVASVSVNENLIYGYHGLGWTFEVKGINVIESDPLFVDVDGIDNILGNPDDDLDVTAGSPSINNGINKNAPGFDFNNFKRPAESIVDIGAFEHNSVLLSIINSSPDALLSNSVEVYPNPSNEDIYIKILRKVDLIEIIDSRGSVLQKYSSPNECLLKVAISAQGLYMIRVSEGGLSELYRVVNY